MQEPNVSNAARRAFLTKAGKAAAAAPAVALLLSPSVIPTAAQAGYHRPKPNKPHKPGKPKKPGKPHKPGRHH